MIDELASVLFTIDLPDHGLPARDTERSSLSTRVIRDTRTTLELYSHVLSHVRRETAVLMDRMLAAHD